MDGFDDDEHDGFNEGKRKLNINIVPCMLYAIFSSKEMQKGSNWSVFISSSYAYVSYDASMHCSGLVKVTLRYKCHLLFHECSYIETVVSLREGKE